jgi:hypothetical protein
LAYTPRLFTQLALPYRNPGDVPRWVRRNGALELVVTPGLVLDDRTGISRPAYPYGVVPRLLVIWMASEVIKTERREFDLGPSFSAFINRVGLTRGGTQFVRVRDQMTRLFAASMLATATVKDGPMSGYAGEHFRVVRKWQLWWSDLRPQEPFSLSSVTLSEEFYESIMAGSVPVPVEAIAELRGKTSSPLALDIYVWLVHRLPRVVKGSTPPIGWADLAIQFGCDYKQVRQFKAQFLKDLRHVLAVYPTARVEPGPKGLVLRRSPSPVQPRALGG